MNPILVYSIQFFSLSLSFLFNVSDDVVPYFKTEPGLPLHPSGVGWLQPGAGPAGLGLVTGRGGPTEGSLRGGDGDGTEACGGTSTEWALGPRPFPGTSNLARKPPRPPPSCVRVYVCVLGKVGPFPPSSATPAGCWAPGEGGLLCLRRASTAAPPAINGARSHFAEPGRDWDNGGD